nr:uncharacterized protein LOC117853365 [Setaria viridis]
MIRPPSTEAALKIRTSPKWYPYFKDCIGAIDGTHVHARVPAKISAAFKGRKHYPTQNVLAAVDFDLRFTYVLAGWEGSAHDALILADALERDDGLRVPPGMAEEVGVIDLAVADEVVHVAGAGAEQRPRGAMHWTSAMSSFVLRRMCQLIESGVRTDKGFKEVHLNQVAKYLQEFSGNEVSGTQVYNHLRKWRQRWMRVSKLRELSGALWIEENCMISLDEEHYKGHIKAHPKDTEFLNKHIENYKEMMIIFGNGLATGKYAMGSNEALGSPFDFTDTSMKTEPYDEDKAAKCIDDVAKVFGEAPKDIIEVISGSGPSKKRKRSVLTEEDHLVMSSMTEAVRDVASAIRETKVEVLNPDLYSAVMYMPGFSEEALICAFSHLVDNKAQGDAFVNMAENHRVLWLRTWLAKNSYM